MNKVHILPPEVISKIAAGEVIERPASVLKELIENSLDAQAESIEVIVKQAGKTFIQIKDNGTGIDPDDIEKIFLRHSTSKITRLSDLFNIFSLGFRGEALYSIAAVSDITLRSKTKREDNGWEIHIRGGEKRGLRPAALGHGTQVEIKELFFNTPARRKFLKSDTTELHQIINTFTPYVILYPKKRFALTHNNKIILDLSGDKDHLSRTAKALNLKPEHILQREKNFDDKKLSLRLLLGDINIKRTRKDMQFIFVNNRPVYNRQINFHLNQTYKLILPSEIYPFFAVYITIPPEDTDVNIHPTKREVKIKDEFKIAALLSSLCKETLLSRGKAKQVENIPFLSDNAPLLNRSPYPSGQDLNLNESSQRTYAFGPAKPDVPPQENIFSQPTDHSLKAKLSKANYIGVFLKKYIFFESGRSLCVIDQHAAQERITYEQLIDQIENGRVEVQHLLKPIILSVTAQEIVLWEVLKDILEKMGLSTTLWDNQNIALHTHPLLIKQPEISLRNLLSGEARSNLDTDSLARRACRNSLMAGYHVSQEQAEYLRRQLIKCKDPFACPHGRPTVVEIKEAVLEKEFLRK
ncbi:MAG: DNA mismatch repair endonuclease MutL [Candidatus Omnitrophota bacterium]